MKDNELARDLGQKVIVDNHRDVITLLDRIDRAIHGEDEQDTGIYAQYLHVYYTAEGWLSRIAFIDLFTLEESVRDKNYSIYGRLLESTLHELIVAQDKAKDVVARREENEQILQAFFFDGNAFEGEIKGSTPISEEHFHVNEDSFWEE